VSAEEKPPKLQAHRIAEQLFNCVFVYSGPVSRTGPGPGTEPAFCGAVLLIQRSPITVALPVLARAAVMPAIEHKVAPDDLQRLDHPGEDCTRRDKNMRYALIIAISLGSTLLAQAEPLDRDKWVEQTGRASKSCLVKFRQKFGEAKGHNYADCVTDQTNKAIDTCIGSSEFSNCVLERSLKVLEVCDLSRC
jgi:hypothetical protein